MKAIEINWTPNDRQLRQFAAAALVFLPLAGWIFSGLPAWRIEWSGFHTQLIGGLAAVGAVLVALSFVVPRAIKPVFIAAIVAAYPIGLVLSEVIMFLMYTLVFAPVALLFRIIGRDALERAVHRDAKTYWQDKAQPSDIRSYYRQS